MSDKKLSFREKIGYGFGDAASSMFWKLFGMYLMFFYTDIFGISAAVVGTMFLVTRLWDAAFDPFVGIVADRTETRWGKFRPYLLWMAIPFGIVGILTFTTPSFSMTGKIIYAYITYSVMMMVYSLINVPYASLLGVMTSDLKERTTLATYRFVFAFGGSILVLASFQPLFDKFGSENHAAFKEPKKVEVKDSAMIAPGKSVYLWSNTLQEVPGGKAVDSLLFLTLKMKTKSTENFQLGVFNQKSNTYHWVNFPAKTDTLGLVRNGTWCDAILKLSDIVPASELVDMQSMDIALATPADCKVDCKKIYIREIEYRSGTQKAVIIVAIVSVLLFLLTFLFTRERVKPVKEQKTSLKSDFSDLLKNSPWFILLGAGIAALIFNSIRDGAALYYFKYYIQSQSAVEVSVIGQVITFTYATLYLVLGQAANIFGVLLAKPISDKIGKSNTFLVAMLVASVLSVMFFWLGRETVVLIFVLQFFISVFAGIIFPLLWSMYADTADYSEWKNGRRATGLIFSSSSMSQKFGWALGSAVTGWLLAIYGFQAGEIQNETTQQGIRMMLSIFPAIGAFISAVFIFFYKLNDKFMSKVSIELAEKRSID